MTTIERLEKEIKLAEQLKDVGMGYIKYDVSLIAFKLLLEDAVNDLKKLDDTNQRLAVLLRLKK